MECSKFDPLEHSTVLYTSTYPDPATGICGPCKVPGCHRCVLEDATRCDGSMYMTRDGCMAGFYLNETDAQCYPCTAVGCSTCSPETPEKCSGIQCSSGYWWDETAEACKPCINGCNVCDLFKGEQCEQCADGYYLEMGTRLCKPVSTGGCFGEWWVAVAVQTCRNRCNKRQHVSSSTPSPSHLLPCSAVIQLATSTRPALPLTDATTPVRQQEPERAPTSPGIQAPTLMRHHPGHAQC